MQNVIALEIVSNDKEKGKVEDENIGNIVEKKIVKLKIISIEEEIKMKEEKNIKNDKEEKNGIKENKIKLKIVPNDKGKEEDNRIEEEENDEKGDGLIEIEETLEEKRDRILKENKENPWGDLNPYFPPNRFNKRPLYSEVIKCLDSLNYTLLLTEEEYNKMRDISKMPGICPGKHGKCNININQLRKGFGCCRECGKEKIKQTNIKIYGVKNPMQNKKIQDKQKSIMKEKYGVENPSQNKKIQDKVKETRQKISEDPIRSKEIQDKKKATNIKKYGVEHPAQNEKVKEKMKETTMKIYGVENAFQNREIKEKIKAKNLERRGVEYPGQSEEVKEKMKETNIKVYGVKYPMQNKEIQEKAKETNIKVYGTEYPMQNKEIQEKAKETNIKVYGVENPMQNMEIFKKRQKTAFRKKEYIFPSGKIVYIQGYENFCIDDLLQEGIKEEEIVIESLFIPYFFEKNRIYFPDIFIPSQNRIIEIKSIYTFEKDKEKNMVKGKACKDAGYLFEFRIYDKKGKLLEKIVI